MNLALLSPTQNQKLLTRRIRVTGVVSVLQTVNDLTLRSSSVALVVRCSAINEDRKTGGGD